MMKITYEQVSEQELIDEIKSLICVDDEFDFIATTESIATETAGTNKEDCGKIPTGYRGQVKIVRFLDSLYTLIGFYGLMDNLFCTQNIHFDDDTYVDECIAEISRTFGNIYYIERVIVD